MLNRELSFGMDEMGRQTERVAVCHRRISMAGRNAFTPAKGARTQSLCLSSDARTKLDYAQLICSPDKDKITSVEVWAYRDRRERRVFGTALRLMRGVWTRHLGTRPTWPEKVVFVIT